MSYFHGGFPGLSVGDYLDPPSVTQTTVTLSEHAAELGSPHGTRRDVVYVTPRQDTARAFAALYTDGALYRVEPVDVVGPDPDAPNEAVMCRRARVLEVVRSRVVFAHRTPESWLRMLAGPTPRKEMDHMTTDTEEDLERARALKARAFGLPFAEPEDDD